MKMAISPIVGAFVLAGVACSGAPLGGRQGTDAGDSALCNRLAADYDAAVTAALACTPGAPNQCQTLVATAPTECPDFACGSQELVNDDTAVERARENWLSGCDSSPHHSCPYNACVPAAPSSICVPNGVGATTGSCVPSPTTDAGSTDGALDGGESCDQLAADYSATVTAALACTPGAPNQCQVIASLVPSGCPLTGCGPVLYVNDLAGVNAAAAKWLRQCVAEVACSGIACRISISSSTCVANDGSRTTGTCTPTGSDPVTTN